MSILQSTFSELVCITAIFTAKFFTKGFAFMYCSYYLYTCTPQCKPFWSLEFRSSWVHQNQTVHHQQSSSQHTPSAACQTWWKVGGAASDFCVNNLAGHRLYLSAVIMPVLPVWLCRVMAKSYFAELGDQLLLCRLLHQSWSQEM